MQLAANSGRVTALLMRMALRSIGPSLANDRTHPPGLTCYVFPANPRSLYTSARVCAFGRYAGRGPHIGRRASRSVELSVMTLQRGCLLSSKYGCGLCCPRTRERSMLSRMRPISSG
jgi:hypothetical protein